MRKPHRAILPLQRPPTNDRTDDERISTFTPKICPPTYEQERQLLFFGSPQGQLMFILAHPAWKEGATLQCQSSHGFSQVMENRGVSPASESTSWDASAFLHRIKDFTASHGELVSL